MVQGQIINFDLCIFLLLSLLSFSFPLFKPANINTADKYYNKAQNLSSKSQFLAN